ncbi:hypothetical protein O1611_g2938 [Lasiodiplodia mahajangana]|uniref:Uncharacterized protein n=1 Tax=Lasiodiplodia mahajangana TaxID=1108764 RepID=A0ACC2JTG2_9PEZI|nr:hypothetical protein O1611_g2938 [Lasiodiplodia mahajangana]
MNPPYSVRWIVVTVRAVLNGGFYDSKKLKPKDPLSSHNKSVEFIAVSVRYRIIASGRGRCNAGQRQAERRSVARLRARGGGELGWNKNVGLPKWANHHPMAPCTIAGGIMALDCETNIAFEGKDARELQRLQNKANKKNERETKQSNTALLAAYREISNFCDAMNISKTTQDAAKHIFKMTDDAKLFKGKSAEVIIAGCIFIACRQSNAPRTFREIFALTKVPKKEIGRTFKLLEKFLQDDKNKSFTGTINQDAPPPTLSATNATELCGRYCSGLRFRNNHLMARFSSELCEKSSSVRDLAGRSPLSVAAACIYMISHLMGESRSSKQIAAVAGVSDGTIKTAYRFLYQERATLIDDEWLAKGGRLDRLPVN